MNTKPEPEHLLILDDLAACRPDAVQPRRVLPENLHGRLLNDAAPTKVLQEAWKRCLGPDLHAQMRSGELSPAEALTGRRDEGILDLALQITLEGLVELAESIARHGLRQPINVYSTGNGSYRIAEGERRWWAHLILRDQLGDEAPALLARVEPLPDDDLTVLARQHAENACRKDLSAVARAIAISRVRETVRAELGTSGSWDAEHGITENELDDLTGQRLAELTGRGISGRMVRNYLSLLSLPTKARELAEAACLTERTLRPIVSLSDSPAEQVRLVHALASGTLTPGQVKREVARLKGLERPPASTATRFWKSLRFAAGDLPEPSFFAAEIALLSEEKRREMLNLARQYADLLEAILRATS